MKVVFNCHTEYDLKNNFGLAKEIEQSKQTFTHLPILLDWIKKFNIPITFSIAVGGAFGENLLNYIKREKIKFPSFFEIGIHYHSEIFENKKWKVKSFLNTSGYLKYFIKFKKTFGIKPKSMVFGKWKIDQDNIDFLSELGIKIDGSFISAKKIIEKPFYINNILEVPVVSFNKEPVNPFTKLSHFFLIRKIIKKYHQENMVLHIGFHSYDFFKFDKNPKLRLIKKIIFKNILGLIKKYNLEVITLSEIKEVNFEELEKIKMPLISSLFELLGH